MTREEIDKLQAEHDTAQWNARRVIYLECERARLNLAMSAHHRRFQRCCLAGGIGGAIMLSLGWWLRGAL